MIRIALHTKVGVIGLVYRKSLRLTPASKAHHTEGEIVNLMQQDSERLMWFIPMSPNLISCSLQVALNSLLLFYYIGVTAVVGIIMLACLIPINRVLVGMQMKLRFATQKHTDNRIKLINEVLKGIKVVKTYACKNSDTFSVCVLSVSLNPKSITISGEDFMKQRVTEIRDKEIRMIKTKSILGALTGLFMWAAPPFATVAVFVLYGMVGHPMDSTSLPQLFTALMLFNNLRIPLMMFPWMLSMFSDAKVSMGRLQEFLMREEIPDDLRSYTSEAGVALRIERAQFQWRTTPKKEKEQSMGGAFGGGVPGGGLGDDGDKPPTVTAICKTDGIGKLCKHHGYCIAESRSWISSLSQRYPCAQARSSLTAGPASRRGWW